jgi:SAM-dependent methyltransferase
VLGLDISGQMVAQAAHNARVMGVADTCAFREGDFEQAWASLGELDGILALGFIEYFDDPRRILEAFLQMLNPQGVAVVQIWNSRAFSSLVEEPLTALTRALHPVRLARSVVRRAVPAAWVVRLRGRPIQELPAQTDVTHRRCSPEQLRRLAERCGFRCLGEAGERFFSPSSRFPERLKHAVEARAQRLAARQRCWYRWMTDYIVALQKP